jgi:hypothetical protein
MLDHVAHTVLTDVHNPMGYPPKVTGKAPAGRLDNLSGKTIFLVDCRFDDSIELLKQVEAWFAEHMPDVTTRMVSLASTYKNDDPGLWNRIKTRGDPWRWPLFDLRPCRHHPCDHAGNQLWRACRGVPYR